MTGEVRLLTGTLPAFDGATRHAPPPFLALLRLHLTYLWRHRRPLALAHPLRFTELVQCRKILDRDERLPHLIDKIAVKRFVVDLLGSAWVTPTLWAGRELPARPHWKPPFVVKSRHGCRQSRFVRDGAENWTDIRTEAARWMRSDYGFWLDEWGYRGIERGLLVEPLVGEGLALPIDYKLYVFHGEVAAIQVHLDREHRHRWMLFDRAWKRLSSPSDGDEPPPPASLGEMIAGAEELARNFDFVRVDLYDTVRGPRFGELTFYPGSGLDRFDPPSLDFALGALWREPAQSRFGRSHRVACATSTPRRTA